MNKAELFAILKEYLAVSDTIRCQEDYCCSCNADIHEEHSAECKYWQARQAAEKAVSATENSEVKWWLISDEDYQVARNALQVAIIVHSALFCLNRESCTRCCSCTEIYSKALGILESGLCATDAIPTHFTNYYKTYHKTGG